MALHHLKLPTETIEQIIDGLALDVHALHACSLICRQWRLRSQYHLLSSIYIDSTTQMDSLANFVSTFPLRAEGIRRVRISISALSGDAILQVPSLGNATTLTLSNATSPIYLPLRLAPLLAMFPNLSSLTIIDCAISALSAAPLMRMLSRFALLRSLSLFQGTQIDPGGYPVVDDADDVPGCDTPLPLEVLALNDTGNTLPLCTLLSGRAWRDVSALRRLELAFPRSLTGRGGQVYDLLVHALPTLHELSLRSDDISPFAEITGRITPGAPRPGPNLKLLNISIGTQTQSPLIFGALLELARAFAHHSSTAIVIDIVLGPSSGTWWRHSWAMVARRLEQAPMLCTSLTLVIRTPIVDENRKALEEAEQMLHPHGVRFSYGTPRAVRPDYD